MSDPVSIFEDVTPELARKYFARNHPNNRPPTRAEVEYLVREAREGRFIPGHHQGIAFDVDGYLFDGQKRLLAIIESGMILRLMVTRGCGRRAIFVVDSGERRTDEQKIHMAGYDARSNQITLVKAMVSGLRCATPRLSTEQVLDLWGRHKEAIKWTLANLQVKSFAKEVKAAAARAFYSIDRATLAQFCELLRTRQPTGMACEASAFLLLGVIDSTRGEHSQDSRKRRYVLTERAIAAFSAGEHLTRLSMPKTDPCEAFPLPEERG